MDGYILGEYNGYRFNTHSEPDLENGSPLTVPGSPTVPRLPLCAWVQQSEQPRRTGGTATQVTLTVSDEVGTAGQGTWLWQKTAKVKDKEDCSA